MRVAGNFSPEWGYLAPAPSFMRTARVVLVATAVGATAGAGVVLSLIDRPAAEGDKTSVAAHAIITGVQVAPATITPSTSAAPAAAAADSATTNPNITTNANVTANAQIQIPAPVSAPILAPAAPPMQAETVVQPRSAAATQSASTASPQPDAARVPTENFGANVSPASAPGSVSGIAALSEAPPATEAVPSELPDMAIIATEPAPPQKKTKHVATAPNAKTKDKLSLESVLRGLFSAHAGSSYYPTRGL